MCLSDDAVQSLKNELVPYVKAFKRCLMCFTPKTELPPYTRLSLETQERFLKLDSKGKCQAEYGAPRSTHLDPRTTPCSESNRVSLQARGRLCPTTRRPQSTRSPLCGSLGGREQRASLQDQDA